MREAQAVFRDRGSRFIGLVFHLGAEQDFPALLERVRKEFPAARHYCYAWRLRNGHVRSSDDGEPAGTAGRPILNQITAGDLCDVAVIVVRYFGGTLLGKGGLINAYRSATVMALEAAGSEQRYVMTEFVAKFGDDDTGAVMRLLQASGAEILGRDYTTGHELRFRIRKPEASKLLSKFEELYRVTLAITGEA